MASVFVVDVPGNDVGVVLIVFCHGPAQGKRILPEHRAGRTPMLACTRPAGIPIFVFPQYFRMRLCEPHRRACGCCGEVCGDAIGTELSDNAVKPTEIKHTLTRFNLSPGEYGDRHYRNFCFFHEADVVIPDLLRPLVRIIITAIPYAGLFPMQRLRPAEFSGGCQISHFSPCISQFGFGVCSGVCVWCVCWCVIV